MPATRFAVVCLSLAAWLVAAPAAADEPRRTENVIVVTLDGFRWQELFGGADDSLFGKEGGARHPDDLKRRFWRDTAAQRRETLLPFFWGTVARQGQVFGDRTRGSPAESTNGLKFSYPGYQELFCGFPDGRINSNDKKNNPNLSVLEFLNEKPAYRGRVAAFCTWDVFPYIFRSGQNGLTVHAGWVPIRGPELTDRQRYANELVDRLPRYWPENVFDVIIMDAAQEHLRRHKPRVLYIGLGETDEWAHARRYDLYLGAAHYNDRFLADLWRTVGELPEYQGKTTLVLATDHGRGPTRVDWTDHGQKVPGAEFIWLAVLGPDTPAQGVRENVRTTQGQVAATVARLLGEDFQAASPRAAPPLPRVCGGAAPGP